MNLNQSQVDKTILKVKIKQLSKQIKKNKEEIEEIIKAKNIIIEKDD